jgi:hypothetical protein
MIRILRFGRSIALAMTLVMLIGSLPLGVAQAASLTPAQVLREAAQHDRGKVEALLQRHDVRDQMVAFGVDPEEAKARVASLSDGEISQIAGQIDALPAGQGVLVALVGAAVFIFVVLLITDLLGLTHIFPFVRHPTR